MKKLKIIFIFALIIGCGLYWFGGLRERIFPPPIEQTTRPDIKSVLETITTSVQKRRQLLVMTVDFQSIATSKFDSMGMTAQQTDIATCETQYYIDLTKISKDSFKMSGNKLIVMLPKSVLVTRGLPPVRKESYNNNSWLFTFSDDTAVQLTNKNKSIIVNDLAQKAKAYNDEAEVVASAALSGLFQSLLDAAGSPKQVEVVFT